MKSTFAPAAFFHALYDQTEPIGSPDRSAHYSVYRTLVWHDPDLTPRKKAAFHDVAVIWDEDHDTRVLKVLARVHTEGLLAAITFIGEMEGVLFVLLDDEGAGGFDDDAVKAIAERIRPQLENIEGDTWSLELMRRSDDHGGAFETAYIDCIDLLWGLGNKKVEIPSAGDD